MTESDTLKLENIACPLCGEDHFRKLLLGKDLLHHAPGDFQLVRCLHCRHVYVNPRPSLDDIGLFYPQEYGPHQSENDNAQRDSSAGSAPVSPSSPSEAKKRWYLNRWVKNIPGLGRLYHWLIDDKSIVIPEGVPEPKRTLDFGCGSGGFLVRLRDCGWNAEGVEFAKAPAEQVRALGFEVHHGTLETAKFEQGQFQAVFSHMVLEHLHEPKTALEEIRRILAEDGWLTLSVPNYSCWERFVFGKYWHALELPRHLQQFSPRTMRALLRETGFSEVRIIHQRNWNQVLGSLGLWFRETGIAPRLGERFLQQTHRPSLAGNLCLAPFAHLAALCRQGGRLTILARKCSDSSPPQSESIIDS